MNKDTVRNVVIPLITGLAGFFASYIALIGVEKQTDADLVSTLYEQVRTLEHRIFERENENTRLRIALEKKFESSEIVKRFIRKQPFPAFVKLVEVDDTGQTQFRMWYLNPEYEQRYGVTLERYVGKTDAEVWPNPEVAQAFYQNDLAVLQSMDNKCKAEMFPTNALLPISDSNPSIGGFVCKWPVRINGQNAIAGQIFQEGYDIVVLTELEEP